LKTDKFADDVASAKRLYEEANEYYEKGFFEKAIELYSKAIARSPEGNPDVYKCFYNRGLALCCLERYMEGKSDIQMVLGLKPDFAEGWYILGLCKEYMKDFDGAAEAYDEALKRDPDFKDAQNRKELLESKRRSGHSDLISKSSSTRGNCHEHDTTMEQVRDLEKEGKFEEALALVETTLRTDPDDFPLLLAKRVLIGKMVACSKPDTLCGLDGVKDTCDRNFGCKIKNFNHRLYRARIVQSSFGMTLHGPPGCGKTSIIVAIAKENGIELVEIVLSEILSMRSGESEKRLTQAFETAKEIARSGKPVIVFIDELDSLGIARTVTLEQGEGSWSRDLRNTFRRLLNEVRDIPNLAIVGATNYLWSVDVALKRPGRMGASIIYVPPPDTKTREEIFRLYSEETPGHESLDYKKLAEITQWFSGDDIQNVCREVYNEVARRIIIKEREEAAAVGRRITVEKQEEGAANMKDYRRFINDRIPTCLSWIQDVARAWIEGRIRNNEVDKRLLADIELACPNAASEREKAKKTYGEDKRRRPEYVM